MGELCLRWHCQRDGLGLALLVPVLFPVTVIVTSPTFSFSSLCVHPSRLISVLYSQCLTATALDCLLLSLSVSCLLVVLIVVCCLLCFAWLHSHGSCPFMMAIGISKPVRSNNIQSGQSTEHTPSQPARSHIQYAVLIIKFCTPAM